MSKLTIDIPDYVDLDEQSVKMMLAGKLYEQEKLTLGQAAAFAGLTKRTFIETIGQYGFSIVSDDLDDLHSDIENA
jgi:predicted HTH domain antitoxin